MLKKLVLKNWQNHKDFSIDFDPLVNTFVGRSDSGKSAIIRALSFLSFNRPSGNTFITEGEEVTTVGLLVDGHKIIRQKGKGINLYKLDDKTYKAFGGEIPEEIQKILNLEKEINFQFQLDSPFWFLDSPGQVSKSLNQIINLVSIDNALAKVALEVRRAKSEYELTEQRCEEAKNTVASLSWVPRFDKALTRLEAQNKQIVGFRTRRLSVAAKLSAVKSLTTTIDRLNGDVLRVQKLEKLSIRARQLREKRIHIENLLEDISRVRELAEIKIPDLNRVLEIRKKGDDISNRRSELESLSQDIKYKKEHLCRIQTQVTSLEKSLTQFVGRNCPTCGQVMTSSLCYHQIGTSALQRRLVARKKVIG